MTAALLLAVALACPAQEPLGGHSPAESLAGPAETPDSLEARRADLEEMWLRRILPPDNDAPSPDDKILLAHIRRDEDAALRYLQRKPGGVRPWVVERRQGASTRRVLTKAGHARYLALLTQDALRYFASKGASAKTAFTLLDWEGRRLFDRSGTITQEGIYVHRRAILNLEVFWRTPEGRVFGTRRPPADPPPPVAR